MLFDYFLILVVLCFSGLAQPYYDIPSFYGHFSLRYFQPSFVLAGKLTLLEYHFEVDANYMNDTIFYANANLNCIYQYSMATQIITVLVGQCGTPGNIVGSKDVSLFNGPSSVAYFRQPSPQLLTELGKDSIVLVQNQSCSLSSAGCRLSSPYPSLQIQNLRYVSSVNLYWDQPAQKEYVYIADTKNHCIKRLSLTDSEVSVVAGKCGSRGFMDGPLGYNRLNSPSNLGVSRQGVLYFFDSGNEYMRFVDLSGAVHTLLLGACKQSGQQRNVAGHTLQQILCYQNWVEGRTQSPVNHYFDPAVLSICSSQSSQCAF